MATILKPAEPKTTPQTATLTPIESVDAPARQLSARDSEQLLHSLENPPAPSPRLLEAASRYRNTQTSG